MTNFRFFLHGSFPKLFGIFALSSILLSCSGGVQRFASDGPGNLLSGEGGVFADSAANLPVPTSDGVTVEPVQSESLGTDTLVVAPPTTTLEEPEPTTTETTLTVAPTVVPENSDDFLTVPPSTLSNADFSSLSRIPIPTRSPGFTGASSANTQVASTTPTQATPPEQAVQATQEAQSTASLQPTSTPSSGILRWPARGKVVSNFGDSQNGVPNDGIDISVPSGTPVKAAESGLVIYADDELKEYGNLVLITHSGDLVTAYAYNDSLTVKKGDEVKRGDVIAASGTTGNAKSPTLHFQVRKDKKPVNPLTYLAAN